jgi:hypothetical protein
MKPKVCKSYDRVNGVAVRRVSTLPYRKGLKLQAKLFDDLIQ